MKNAESAVRKIQAYDDTHDQVYDMSRLVMVNETDAVSLKTYTETLHGINSKDKDVVAKTAKEIHLSSQKYTEETRDENGVVEQHSLDKNALSKGAYQVVNWYTHASLTNHKDAYQPYTDSLISYVDGSQYGLDPYESIVLEVEDYCAENNVVRYHYQMGTK